MKNIIKKILNSKLFKFCGISLINYDLVKYLKHYLWIFHTRAIPVLAIQFNKPAHVASEDITLSNRLIAAYQKATLDRTLCEKNISRLWSYEIRRNCGTLMAAIDRADAQELARLLVTMFRRDFVYGVASGNLVAHASGPIGRKIWSMKYQDNVVALAEYLGVVRAESTQQGTKAYALIDGFGAVVNKIEKSLGMPIGFPDIGSPYGVKTDGSLITMEHPEHLYVALRLSRAVNCFLKDKINKPLDLVEIGAGYGGLAYCIMKLNKININSYTIIDLPLINVLQGYFLMKVFGSSSVNLYGEPTASNAVFSIIPNSAYEGEMKNQVDVLINENSMPEMSEEIVENYMKFAKKHVSGLFFSYNHEAYNVVYGKPQVFVPEVVERVGGFKRLSRNASWVRSGYVEEVYQIVK